MISSRAYLIRGIYEWIMDNHSIPHLLVNANIQGVIVPENYVENGEIAFDVSPQAAPDLVISNEAAEFRARFGGRVQSVFLPIESVMAIYDTEGEGLFFDDLEMMGMKHVSVEAIQEEINKESFKVKKGKPHLKIVD